MNINIFRPGAEFQIAEFVELPNKCLQLILGPLLDISEVEERFLDNLSLVPEGTEKHSIHATENSNRTNRRRSGDDHRKSLYITMISCILIVHQ
jgi:hypothetical protein